MEDDATLTPWCFDPFRLLLPNTHHRKHSHVGVHCSTHQSIVQICKHRLMNIHVVAIHQLLDLSLGFESVSPKYVVCFIHGTVTIAADMFNIPST